jgi:hypothetical protein
MIRLLVIGVLLITSVGSAAVAQSCGEGLPCGPIPWQLPRLPDLHTPTPVPTIAADATDQSGYIPIATDEPQATAMPSLEVAWDDSVLQMESYLTTTPVCILDVYGNCADADPQAYAPEPFLLFGYFRGLAAVNFGPFNPVVWFLVAAFTSVVGMKFAHLLLPVIMVLLGLIRKFVNLILNFLPF